MCRDYLQGMATRNGDASGLAAAYYIIAVIVSKAFRNQTRLFGLQPIKCGSKTKSVDEGLEYLDR